MQNYAIGLHVIIQSKWITVCRNYKYYTGTQQSVFNNVRHMQTKQFIVKKSQADYDMKTICDIKAFYPIHKWLISTAVLNLQLLMNDVDDDNFKISMLDHLRAISFSSSYLWMIYKSYKFRSPSYLYPICIEI